MSEATRLHAVITGQVQGVGFRFFIRRNANQLGLTGWVRNRADTAVEIVAEGNGQDLQEFVTKLRAGPQMSWVQDVAVQWETAKDGFDDFLIAPTVYA